MTEPRMRMAALVGTTALAMSLALAPVAMAQDGPAAPANEVLAAVAEGRFSDVTVPFCAELEADAFGGLGRIDDMLAMGMGYDLGLVFEALDIDVDGVEVSIIEEADESAVVNLSGSIELGLDEDGVVTLMSVMLADGDEPLDEEVVRTVMLPMMEDQIGTMFGGTVDVDEDVQVVLEDGVWQVCDDLTELGNALMGAMGAPAGTVPVDE